MLLRNQRKGRENTIADEQEVCNIVKPIDFIRKLCAVSFWYFTSEMFDHCGKWKRANSAATSERLTSLLSTR